MIDGSALVCIDFWHTTVRAVLRRPDGTWSTVSFDGDTSMPTGVAVREDGTVHAGAAGALIGAERPDTYVRLPGQRLFDQRLQVGPVTVDPVDLAAAVLAQAAHQVAVAAGAAVPGDVVICTPAWCVPRQAERLRMAARRAGLANPRLLDCADAIVRDQMARAAMVPVGAVIVVCRLDATVGEVVVLCRRIDGLERLATHPIGEVGETAGATTIDQAATALTDALQSAGIGGGQVAAVFCHAPEAEMARLADVLTAAAGLAVAPVRVDDLAAARGGLHTTLPIRPARARWRYARLLYSLAGVVAGGFGAGTLAYQLFTSSLVYEATSTSPKTLITQWCAWGLESIFAQLALVSTVVAWADLRAIRPGSTGDPDRPDPKLGSGLIFAAAVGVGQAAMLALIGGAHFGFTPTPILAWTLGSTGPSAAVVAVLGVLCTRVPIRGGWRDRLRFPVEGLAVAAVSTVAIVGAYTGVPFTDRDSWWMLEHVGAVGIGLAIAWPVTRRPARLVIVATLLGVPATFAISIDTFTAIGTFLIGAITLWWLARLVHIGAPMLAGRVGAPVGRASPVSGPDGPGELG